MNYAQAKARADILKALAHPLRILLVEALSRGERCVNDLTRLADVDQSTISRHLAQLKKAGIVAERKTGTKVIHRLACPCMLRALDCSVEVLKTVTHRQRTVLRGACREQGIEGGIQYDGATDKTENGFRART